MRFLKAHKRWFIGVLVSVCVAMAALYAADWFAPSVFGGLLGAVITPAQRAAGSAASWVGAKIDAIIKMDAMADENRELQELVEKLSAENNRLRNVDETNRRLSELLLLNREYSDYPTVGANIIARSADNWYNTFVIDKGSKDGMEKDMAVLASGGLCGRIYEVGWNYSKVRPLIDDTSSVSAEVSRTEDIGYVRGDLYLMLESKCVMDFLGADAAIVPGDELTTSRLSTVYPPGIVIGEVISVENAPNGSKRAIVKPRVDFSNIRAVLVITELFNSELIDEEPERYSQGDPNQ
jgi:rod shape-determining protein MreC